jgi:hypothetical protein
MRVFILFLLFFAGSAWAERPWYNPVTGEDVFYKTAHEACSAVIPRVIAHWNSYGSFTFTIEDVSAGYGPCSYQYTRSDGNQGRSNDTIDSVISQSLPAHECTAAKPDQINWPFGVKDTPTGDVKPDSAIIPPALICSQGCMHERGSVKSCYAFTEDDPLKVYCDWNTTQNGSICSTTDEPVRPELPDGPADPCHTNPAAPGCTDGGDGDGGDNGGGTDPGDGTTNPGNGGTNPGDGSTNPGNGGTNPGGGDSSGGSVSGIECDQALSCSGDAIQCAILEVQNRARCASLNAGDFPSQEGDISGLINSKGDAATLDEGDGEIDVSGLFSGPTDARFLPAACPPPKTFNLTTLGGRTFEFTYEPLCQLAIDLSYLIVIAASLFYAIYVGRASGGE